MCSNFNSQMFAGFLHGFVESLSVILVSEIGDKTFFIAAILAMSNNKLTVEKQKNSDADEHFRFFLVPYQRWQ